MEASNASVDGPLPYALASHAPVMSSTPASKQAGISLEWYCCTEGPELCLQLVGGVLRGLVQDGKDVYSILEEKP